MLLLAQLHVTVGDVNLDLASQSNVLNYVGTEPPLPGY